MKIIIVGLGETGTTLLRALSGDNHDITVIDKDKSLIDRVTDKYSVSGVVGSGASKETLMKAGVNGADIFVALTHIDEINLLCCMQAKKCGAGKTVARLQLPDLANDMASVRKEYDIDYIVRPRIEIADEIHRNMGLPGFIKLEGLFGDEVMIIDMSVMRDSPLAGRTLMDIRKNVRNDMLVGTVIRDDKLYIPDGSFTIEEGDSLTISVPGGSLNEILETFGIKRKSSDNVMMVCCGIIGDYLCGKFTKEGRKLTILENDIDRCRSLMEKYPTANVAYSDGEITEVLEEEGINKIGTLISLTSSDETNLVIAMFAWSKKVPSVITRVDKQSHVRLLHKVNIDITASPTELSVHRILHFIRNSENKAGGSYRGFYSVAEGKAEVIEFTADKNFKLLNIPIKSKEFKIKKNVLISGIIKNNNMIIPSGDSIIEEGDRVIITTGADKRIRSLDDIL